MKPGRGWWRTATWLGALALVFTLACETRLYIPPPPPPAPPPMPAPPPQVIRPTLYVSASRLNLRMGPGMDFPKISALERNDEVEKVWQSEDWAQVRVKKDGRLGWVSSRYLSETPVAAVPEVAPSPPAPPAPPPAPQEAPPPPQEVTPPPKPPVAEKPPKPVKPEAPAAAKKKAEERPAKAKPAEAAEPARRKAPPAEKATPKEEKPAPEPAPDSQKRIRIM